MGSSADKSDVQEVARLYRVKALVDTQATKKQLESLLEGTEVIHLAAHALLAFHRPFERAILWAATSEDDGRMRVCDIDAKTLRARLVVRSCCSMADGAGTGDGVLSLCRGLLAAGAHTVLASLWAVADESTAFTMIDFHRRGVENPFHSTLAEGVRQSQLATRAKYPSHAQWAPFVLWGWPYWVQSPHWSRPSTPIVGKAHLANSVELLERREGPRCAVTADIGAAGGVPSCVA